MTTNKTTSTTTSTTPTAPQTGELVHVPAEDLVIEDNIRTAADLDAGFLASITRHGVLLPTIGYRTEDGQIVVRDGQLRVLAARQAGIEVPVFVTDRATAEAARVTEQLVTNEHRTALSPVDRLAAFRQLELAGLSQAQIARDTGTRRESVATVLAVAKSEAAATAVAEQQLTLDAALILAEFEGDEDALKRLREAADSSDEDELAFIAEEIRQERTRHAAAATLTAEYQAQGIRVLTPGDRDGWTRLSQLSDQEREPDDPYAVRPALTVEEHTGCPGRAVCIAADWGEPEVIEGCTTPDAHHPRYQRSAQSTPAAEQSEQEQEDARAERKRLIANNKAWDAAETIRREWVASFLQRKTMPKDAAVFVATTLTRFGGMIRADNSSGIGALLGLDSRSGFRSGVVADWVHQNPAKAMHVVLAHAISAFENTANRTWWRYPTAEGQAYLTQLGQWGYPLSTVEKIAAGHLEADTDTATDV